MHKPKNYENTQAAGDFVPLEMCIRDRNGRALFDAAEYQGAAAAKCSGKYKVCGRKDRRSQKYRR